MNELVSKTSWLLASVAALNWGAVEALDTNILTDLLALGPEAVGVIYLIIGIAGIVNVIDFVEEVL